MHDVSNIKLKYKEDNHTAIIQYNHYKSDNQNELAIIV